MRIEPLCKQHDRKDFDCGNEELNRYFREQVSQDVRRCQCACFVLQDEETLKTSGFYTLSPYLVSRDKMAMVGVNAGRRAYVTAYLLGKLAVDTRYKKRGFGSSLILDAVSRCLRSEIPATGLLVDLKTTDLLPFYESNGFVKIDERQAFFFFPKRKI